MNRASRMMTKPEFRALVRVARDRKGRAAQRDAAMLWFLGRSGLRITEALALTVEDAILDAKPAFVRVRTLKRRGKGDAWDDVYLDRTTTARLERWIAHGLRRCLGRKARPTDPIFPAAFGALEAARMTRRNGTRIFRFYAKRANLRAGITLHSLRHHSGTATYHATGDLQFVRQQLRHRRLTSTQVYLHSDPERVRGYLEQLEEELSR